MLKALAAATFLLWTGLFAEAPAVGVDWQPLESGLNVASQQSKYGFISVYTDWCGYCRRLEQQTLKAGPVLRELKKNFISIKLNAESEDVVTWKGSRLSKRELAAKWGVSGFPTLLFLNSKGEIIGSFASYADADLMLKLLTYISSGAREKNQSFEDFIKKTS